MTARSRVALPALVLVASFAVRVGSAAANLDPQVHLRPAVVTARREASVVRFARRFLGIRYAYGGTTPAGGFDCSGFTRFVYAHFGVSLPHYSGGQFAAGRRVSRARLRPGDLVFFDGLDHVGIYVGGGRFIHAPHTGTRVSIDPLGGWYGARYDGARRLL